MNNLLIKGYRRGNGVYGIRNKIIVLSTVCCANTIVEQISKLDGAVIPIIHQHGCDHVEIDREQVIRTFAGICSNPNIGGVLLVGLGCESTSVEDIIPKMNNQGKIVKSIIIQKIGSRDKIVKIAKKYLTKIKEFISQQKLEEFNISNLVVGVECGASDPFSGITANPAVGFVSDKLVKLGATVILGEIPEMIGTENVLENRIEKETIKKQLFSEIKNYIKISKQYRCDLLGTNPTPGNIRAGLSTIEEKSLGCIVKAGTSKIQEFIKYAEVPKSKGLVVMNTPGNDPESITGMVAGGTHVILFTTGLGTPLGNPIAPVIKISSNSKIYNHMKDFMDIDAGVVVKGVEVSKMGDKIFNFLIDVCNGKRTKSEINSSVQIAINRLGPTF